MSPAFLLTSGAIADQPPFDHGHKAGAVVTFDGRVRDTNEGSKVVRLEYSAYAALAEREGARIMQDALSRFGLIAAAAAHRVGVLLPGELAVRVWVAAAHRAEAFLGCSYIIDAIKKSVPIWKRETYDSGVQAWVACTHGRGDATDRHVQPTSELQT